MKTSIITSQKLTANEVNKKEKNNKPNNPKLYKEHYIGNYFVGIKKKFIYKYVNILWEQFLFSPTNIIRAYRKPLNTAVPSLLPPTIY